MRSDRRGLIPLSPPTDLPDGPSDHVRLRVEAADIQHVRGVCARVRGRWERRNAFTRGMPPILSHILSAHTILSHILL